MFLWLEHPGVSASKDFLALLAGLYLNLMSAKSLAVPLSPVSAFLHGPLAFSVH